MITALKPLVAGGGSFDEAEDKGLGKENERFENKLNRPEFFNKLFEEMTERASWMSEKKVNILWQLRNH